MKLYKWLLPIKTRGFRHRDDGGEERHIEEQLTECSMTTTTISKSSTLTIPLAFTFNSTALAVWSSTLVSQTVARSTFLGACYRLVLDHALIISILTEYFTILVASQLQLGSSRPFDTNWQYQLTKKQVLPFMHTFD